LQLEGIKLQLQAGATPEGVLGAFAGRAVLRRLRLKRCNFKAWQSRL
jgi:hypothetical protein